MPKSGITVFLIFLSIIACNGSDVTRPPDVNDYDAVYHIVSIDRAPEFNIDLLDFSIPDTMSSMLAQLQLEHYWFNLTYDSLDLPIDIEYPDAQDSLGTLPEAYVRKIKFFYGTLEIIGIDTAGGGQEPIRRSTDFAIRGEIYATFKKFGSDYNYRRGWLLTEISDVVFSAAYPQGITQITINSASYPELIVSTGLKSLDDILVFAPGEYVTVTINGSDPGDIFRLRYPQGNGFQTVLLEPDFSNNFITEFQMPGIGQFNHFLVEAVGKTSFREDGPFRYEAIGVLFEVE
ncbi:MAG: hypothetical protein JSU85_02780 [Candidatus Zixiibacteriota bacterium]|nr:MAG: hypothetical protein JSU85_02780 [candidate division Zixibacteria bacterium]